jgi:tetratricopeptide (TPR) repeat protein
MSDTVLIRAKNPDEYDLFLAIERAIGGLFQLLAEGRVDEAADIYMRCQPELGYTLISDAQGDRERFKQVANLLYKARDYDKAAECCEQLEEHEKAAMLYEKAGSIDLAANMYAAAGNKGRAAAMFEKNSSWRNAAQLYRDTGDLVRAANCLFRMGEVVEGTKLYRDAGREDLALQALQTVEPGHPQAAAVLALVAELTPAPAAAAPAPIELSDVVEGNVDAAAHNGQRSAEGFDVLARLPMFSEVSLEELKSLYHLCELRQTSAGEALLQSGQAVEALWVIVEGDVEVRGPQGQSLARLGSGQSAGEMGLIDDAPASADVVVSTPGTALRLDRAGLAQALAASDRLALNVYSVWLKDLSRRLRETTARVV